jgi:nucleoside-diphosphate-sugar epimerase
MEIRDSKCVVVGGAGFLGSHLVDHLIEDRSCEVLVLDNLISGHRKFVNKKAQFLWHDITQSEENTRKVLASFGAEYVFNYAAEPYIPVSFERPVHVAEINAMGALKVIQAAQEAGAKKILQVSSAEIYGKLDGKKNEATPIEAHSTYGVAKVFADGMVQVRAKEAGAPVIAMRQFNCYGPRETHPYVIPEIITQVARGNTIRLGNNSFRDFQYAGDAVKMAVELLEKGTPGEVYNMGSEAGIQIYDLAKMIGRLMGKEVAVEPDPARMRPWEIWHLQSDNTKLFETIGTRPEMPFVQGLAETIQYFNLNGDKWDFN